MNAALARCLAKLCGDGHISSKYARYNNTCKTLLSQFEKDLIEIFGEIHLTRGMVNSGTSFIQFQRKAIVEFFLSYLESFGCNKIKIPKEVFDGSMDVRLAFIGSFFDDEGCVGLRFSLSENAWKRNINFYSNSYGILREISEILFLNGISCNKLRRNNKLKDNTWVLGITGRANISLFRKHVPVAHPRKRYLLDLMVESYGATPSKNTAKFMDLLNRLKKERDN